MDFFSRSPDQTRRVGIRLGQALRTGDVICLQGDLGAGKTTFVQGIAQGPLIIEWPERMDGLIPGERLWVQLEYVDEEEREMRFKSSGTRYDDLLRVIRHATFGAD